jgi:hypothetical protein
VFFTQLVVFSPPPLGFLQRFVALAASRAHCKVIVTPIESPRAETLRGFFLSAALETQELAAHIAASQHAAELRL